MLKLVIRAVARVGRDTAGVTALEYAVIATATVAAGLVALSAMGTNLNTLFTAIGAMI